MGDIFYGEKFDSKISTCIIQALNSDIQSLVSIHFSPLFFCSMQIQPLSDRVILKAVEKEKVTSSGIFLPDSNKNEPPHLYEVIAVGPGKKDKNGEMILPDVAPGDRVIAGRYS